MKANNCCMSLTRSLAKTSLTDPLMCPLPYPLSHTTSKRNRLEVYAARKASVPRSSIGDASFMPHPPSNPQTPKSSETLPFLEDSWPLAHHAVTATFRFFPPTHMTACYKTAIPNDSSMLFTHVCVCGRARSVLWCWLWTLCVMQWTATRSSAKDAIVVSIFHANLIAPIAHVACKQTTARNSINLYHLALLSGPTPWSSVCTIVPKTHSKCLRVLCMFEVGFSSMTSNLGTLMCVPDAGNKHCISMHAHSCMLECRSVCGAHSEGARSGVLLPAPAPQHCALCCCPQGSTPQVTPTSHL